MTLIQIVNLTTHTDPTAIGQKASSIRWLISQGFRVPKTYVCPYSAYAAFLANQAHFEQCLAAELGQKLDLTKEYAVRSSADVEDSLAYSFAGQLTSVLSVQGLTNLVAAVIEVYQSLQAPQLQPYLEKMTLAAEAIQLAVIIQEMAQPVVSGVVFSKNPITGLDELIVEAIRGRGAQLMQDGVTPERWVHKWGAWTEQPSNPQIDHQLIAQVVEQAKGVVKAYGRPIDLEWVWDGQTIYWLQLRPITALEHLNIYSNRISREVLPGLIKPLIWSINVPLVNGAWIDLFTELIGPNDLLPENLSKAFHYRAYFNMQTIGQVMETLGLPRETLELMIGLKGGAEAPTFRPTRKTLRHLPRMIRAALAKYWYDRKLKQLIPAMQLAFTEFESRPIPAADEQQILERIAELFTLTQQVAYANIVTPLLMLLYNALLKRSLARRGVDYIQLDLAAGLAQLADYDPRGHLERLGRQFLALEPAVRQQIVASSYAEFRQLAGIEPFQQQVAAFIAHFGHLSDSGNDFSSQPWRETPDLLLRMITEFKERDPEKKHRLTWAELPLSRLSRWQLQGLYGRARQFSFYREAVSFLYTYGYNLFRACYLALGHSFANRGLIPDPVDIFYLYAAEVQALVAAGKAAEPQMALIRQRQKDLEASRAVVLPEIIYGDQPPPLELSSSALRRLTGIATSPGYYRGPVRVVQRVMDYDRVQPGDVLVIPYSDVSWTPLFAKAGAVVAESGGILSHSSIVAREHNLPAVVSVTGACHMLTDGTLVLIDGYKGEVILPDGVVSANP